MLGQWPQRKFSGLKDGFQDDRLPSVLLNFKSSLFNLFSPPPLQQIFARNLLYVEYWEKREIIVKNLKRQGPIESPKVQMTEQRKNSDVINELKTPNLEKRIL